ncbi:MAG: helix-turn-helix domain-containing protein [Nitrospirae bacterium]|nr:helix-turn-helix domain-containing protein [Nitrospirota bacterium]
MLGKDSVPVTADTEGFLRVPEVATQLNISTYRVYELCRQGALQSVKLGKSVRVKPADLAAYLATQGA